MRDKQLESGLFVGLDAGPELGDGLRLDAVLCGGVLDLVRDKTDADQGYRGPGEQGKEHQDEGPGPFALQAPCAGGFAGAGGTGGRRPFSRHGRPVGSFGSIGVVGVGGRRRRSSTGQPSCWWIYA